MRKIVLYIILATLVTGCQTEINLDYNSVNPLFVIEGQTTTKGSEVRITRTSDMDQWVDTTPVSGASVTVIDEYGFSYPLSLNDSGVYYSYEALPVNYGDSYILKVDIEGESFLSESTYVPPVLNLRSEFKEENIAGQSIVYCKVSAQRIVDQDSYYRYKLYHNGVMLLWGVARKLAEDKTPIQL